VIETPRALFVVKVLRREEATAGFEELSHPLAAGLRRRTKAYRPSSALWKKPTCRSTRRRWRDTWVTFGGNMRTRLVALLCVGAVLACRGSPKQQKQDSGASRSDKLLLVRNALPGRYIVVLEDSVPASELAGTAHDLARRYKGTVLHVCGPPCTASRSR
jgi:hypothetical protein